MTSVDTAQRYIVLPKVVLDRATNASVVRNSGGYPDSASVSGWAVLVYFSTMFLGLMSLASIHDAQELELGGETPFVLAWDEFIFRCIWNFMGAKANLVTGVHTRRSRPLCISRVGLLTFVG